MSEFLKKDIKNILNDIDVSKYSHLIVCINRSVGTFFFRFVGIDEELDEVILGIKNQGIYRMVSVDEICDCIFEFEEYDEEEVNKAQEALDYATVMHDGQYRKDGTEYINHPIRVANYVSAFKSTLNMDVLLASAYLHDTLEDTDATYYDIVSKFGPQVASLVLELTTDEDIKKLLGKTKYLEIKMKNMSSWALVIKLCDRLDNVSDLANSDEAFRNRYVKETIEILDYLLNNRELSQTHIAIIKSILDCLVMCNVKNEQVETTIKSVDKKLKVLA